MRKTDKAAIWALFLFPIPRVSRGLHTHTHTHTHTPNLFEFACRCEANHTAGNCRLNSLYKMIYIQLPITLTKNHVRIRFLLPMQWRVYPLVPNSAAQMDRMVGTREPGAAHTLGLVEDSPEGTGTTSSDAWFGPIRKAEWWLGDTNCASGLLLSNFVGKVYEG